MKRPRSHDDEPSLKDRDWDRHHRRFHDDDRDPSRPNRRRFDFDRYRDAPGGGGGDRLNRSESFSALRRDHPKGFRSERIGRDRGSSSSLWQLQSRRLSSENRRSSVDSLRARDDASRREDLEKREEKVGVNRESCSSSEMEMEEGELQPEPEIEIGEGDEAEKKRLEPCDGCTTDEAEKKRLEPRDGCTTNGEKEQDRPDENDDNVKELGEDKRSLSEKKEETIEPEDKDEENVGKENETSNVEENEVEEIKEEKQEDGRQLEDEDVGVCEKKEELDVYANNDANVEKKEDKGIDLEVEPEDVIAESNDQHGGVLELMKDKLQEKCKDKGKSIVVSNFGKDDFVEVGDAGEGPSSRRGFELVFPSDSRVNCGGVVIGQCKDDKPKLECLDLSLGLPGISKQLDSKPSSPSRARSFQSLTSSFHTMSDGFTNSVSFSGSQTFVHYPSCSLTQNSLDNYEQSVGSRPIFHGVDLSSNGTTVWQAQASNEPKWKGVAGPLFPIIATNDNSPNGSLQALNGHQNPKPNSISRQSSLHSHGSRDTRTEHNKSKRVLTRERSSGSLFRNQQQDGEQLALNGGSFERIIAKAVSEPLQLVCRIFQEMPDQSVAYLKETISEMIVKAEKQGKMSALQEVLEKRSDLTMETMQKCPRNLLEILVALKTGLPDFLRRAHINIPSSDLVEIFFNLKCRNLTCRNLLPVDDCECKICVRKSGFCSACMCLVCSKFDSASNTCGWVGCDVCLHWCHTECALRDSHIRSGCTSSGAEGMTEMLFHCIGCDHRSEMFGFVKDVFKTCGQSWNAETLTKELQYVRRIFSASTDVKGRRLCSVAEQMLGKLEDKANLSQVIDYIMWIFTESEADTGNCTSIFPPKENVEGNNLLASTSKEAPWMPSSTYRLEKTPRLENTGILSSMDYDRVSRLPNDAVLPTNTEKKPVVDELESVVRLKQAEAKMYQEHADTARREGEGLKRIAVAKNAKIEEEYSTRIAKLRLLEAEERRRQKLEELQVIERAHREFFNMKMRMESDINALLLKMESMKRNFNT